MSDDMLKCALCDFKSHVLAKHVTFSHNLDPIEYSAHHGALFSPYGAAKMKELRLKEPRQRKKVLLKELFANWSVDFDDETWAMIFAEPTPITPTLDPNYVFPEDTTLEILTILEKPVRNNVWISGNSGSGKSTLVRNLAAKCNAPLYEFNGDEHKRTTDAFGRWLARDGATLFRYGIIVKWLQHGGWLLINEYDTLDSSVVNAFKSCLEFPRRLTLTENDDEVIIGHPDCRLIVTCNTQGRGDDSGMFVNTQVQSIADLRRFDAFFVVDYLAKEAEEKLLTSMFEDLPEKAAKNIVEVANRTRAAFKKGALGRVLSTAECINWAENYLLFSTGHHAARVSFLNSYEDEARMSVRDFINAVFGQEDSEILHDTERAAKASDKSTDLDDD